MKKFFAIFAVLFLVGYMANAATSANADLTVKAHITDVPLAITWDAGADFTLLGTFYTHQTYTVGLGSTGWSAEGNYGNPFDITYPVDPLTASDGQSKLWFTGTDGHAWTLDPSGKGTKTGTVTFDKLITGGTTGDITFTLNVKIEYQ